MRVGFVGVGAMGGAMARRALVDGLEVAVFDLNKAACAALAEKGAEVAAAPKSLAERCEGGCGVVVDDGQVRSGGGGSGGAGPIGRGRLYGRTGCYDWMRRAGRHTCRRRTYARSLILDV